MSSDVEIRSVAPGDEAFLDEAWAIKERISRSEGVLGQSRDYFAYEYRRSTAYVPLSNRERSTPSAGPDALGFAVVDANGYLSLLGVDPDRRREGLGTRLVAAVADDYDSVTCHARASNDAAVAFYERLGFAVERRVDSYYPDGADAYSLRREAGHDGD